MWYIAVNYMGIQRVFMIADSLAGHCVIALTLSDDKTGTEVAAAMQSVPSGCV